MVETWRIEWETYNFEDGLKEGFKKRYKWYMILLKKEGFGFLTYPELMYIGSTKTNASERLLKNHEALKSAIRDFKNRSVVLGLGYLTSRKTLTEANIRYIESAMIAKFKPRLNAVGVKKFVPRGT